MGIEIPTISNHFFDKLVEGAVAELEGTKYQVIIAPAGPNHDNGPRAIQALADRQVDGILAVSPAVPPAWLENLARRIPLVMIGRHDESVGYDIVVDDDVLGSRLAVEHLYQLGHRDIAHLTLDPGAENKLPQAPHALRTKSYLATMEELGLESRARILYNAPTEEATYTHTLEILDSADRPTAIFAGHDELALGALRAVAERGLTAADVSVIGYDDVELASHPLVSLSTIHQPAVEMGATSMRLLLERIAGRTTPVHEVFTPTLRARGSSAAPVSDQHPHK
nr:substrate-binding domain-containing protein [Tessaracoccus sp. OS52]